MNPLLDDPWIAARIEAAVAPYVGRLSDEQIAWMKEQMAASLEGHENAATLLHRARPVHVDESAEVRRDQAGGATPRALPRGKKKAG